MSALNARMKVREHAESGFVAPVACSLADHHCISNTAAADDACDRQGWRWQRFKGGQVRRSPSIFPMAPQVSMLQRIHAASIRLLKSTSQLKAHQGSLHMLDID